MPINKKSLSVKLRNAIGSSSSQRKLVTSPRLLSDWRAAEPGGDISAFSQCKGKWIITDVWIVQRFLYSAGWSRAGTSDSQDGPGPPLPAHGAGTVTDSDQKTERQQGPPPTRWVTQTDKNTSGQHKYIQYIRYIQWHAQTSGGAGDKPPYEGTIAVGVYIYIYIYIYILYMCVCIYIHIHTYILVLSID